MSRLVFCSCLFLSAFLYGETILFNKEVDGKNSEVRWEVQHKGDKLLIKGISTEDTTYIECSSSYEFQQFITDAKNDAEKFICQKDSNRLTANKAKQGKKEEESYVLENLPWVQDFSFGLRPFLESDKDKFLFHIVNPKDLSLKTMVATKLTVEDKVINGKTYLAQKVKITLDGFYKKFWKAELWFDTRTKQMLIYKANEGPGTPTTTLTFKEG